MRARELTGLFLVLLSLHAAPISVGTTDDAAPAILLVQSDVYVQPHVRSDGTFVPGHMRSAPDGNPYNNYSYPGNRNPYTGNTAPGNPDTYLRNYNNRARGGSSWGGNLYGGDK